ncbi:uncharacterized protein TM35_000113520 [Trypanosoma theileri]|uniref:Uncharacterized protein n=1 Tax=Trypanosoma theileri TaxID=67003 RepID=A0A1X0NZ42_9TRYP|nr:uncharacterized protein TM35_000113520 [Trypanosoma theileri]ORC89818.1 hypothetical protein TM35_000113520 [Trypanosoma theileri]
MPPKTLTADMDPMLQETYLQDDAKDFTPSSQALDQFEARLISGQPAHSNPPSRRQVLPTRGLPTAHCSNHQLHHQQGQQQQVRISRASNPSLQGDSSLSPEAQERLDDIEAVRALGNDVDEDDD